MAKRRVLIIEDDEWERTLLMRLLEEAGYAVMAGTTAQEGYEKARDFDPDCIVCDVMLPDIDGYWVARRVRMEAGRVSTAPFLFLTGVDDKEAKIQAFNVGADAYMTKPYRHEEVVAQVAALIDMARRLQVQRDSFIGPPPSGADTPALRGDVAQMSVATVLTLLEMERRTGRLKVRSHDGSDAVIEIYEGNLLDMTVDDESGDPIALLRQVLGWKAGRFWFRDEPVSGTEARRPMGSILLEVMKAEDEANR